MRAISGGERVVGNVAVISKTASLFLLWVHLKSPIYETHEEAKEAMVATILAMCVAIQNRLCRNMVLCCNACNESGDRHFQWLL